jgi:two-component system KDP operon response regulator KdpE
MSNLTSFVGRDPDRLPASPAHPGNGHLSSGLFPRLQPCVLVAQDEPRSLHFTRGKLEQQGFLVVGACDGHEALQRTRDDLPDAVLLDCEFSDQDAFDVLEQIREWSTVPIILLGGNDDEADKIRGLNLGADDYVTKPFSPGELGARIKSALRRSSWAQAQPTGFVSVDDHLQTDFRLR